MARIKFWKKQLITAVLKGDLEKVKFFIRIFSHTFLSTWPVGYDLFCQSLRERYLEIAKVLLNHGCMISVKCGVTSALHLSILYGDVEILQIIRKRWFMPHQENSQKMAPLHMLAQRKPVNDETENILNYLLNSGSKIHIKHCETGFMPIHFAAECGNTDMVLLLLKKQALINGKAKENRSPLHIAALNGQARMVSILLEQGANYKEKDSSSKTALCLAVENEDMETIKAFLNYSSDSDSMIKEDDMIIYCACQTLNKFLIEMFLQKGGNPNKVWKKTGNFPLHTVIENESEDLVRLLLKYGANPNVEKRTVSTSEIYSRPTGYTPLHLAAEKDHFDILNLLLKKGANPNVRDEEGRTPLHLSVKNGSLLMTSALLDSTCEISSLFTSSNPHGYTPLHIAVENGNKDLVKLFLDEGIPVDSTTKARYTSLHLAVQNLSKEIVELLLEYKANPSTVGPSMIETPLFLAAEVGSLDILEALSEVTKDRKERWLEGFASLYISSFHGHENIVKFLLRKEVCPNSNFYNFLTPLHAAAQQGHTKILNLLLDYKAEVNPEWNDEDGDKRFSTPLLAAVLHGHEEIVEILLNRGADVHTKIISRRTDPKSKFESLLTYGYESHLEFNSNFMKTGYTPLHFAVESGNKAIVEMIVKRGADLNSTAENKTALSIAVENQHVDIVACLLQAGAYAGPDTSGNSVLCTAIVKQNLAIVELLLKYNAPVNFTIQLDYATRVTPFQLAIMKSSAEIVEIFLRKDPTSLNTIIAGEIVLHYAIETREEDIAKKLIEKGANVNSVCAKGFTPLFHATKRGQIGTFKLLLKKGACFEKKTNDGLSLLHYALGNVMNEDMVELIVNCGANVNEKSIFNISPIERIFHYYNVAKNEIPFLRLFKLFLANGLDVDTKMLAIKKSLLHYACHMKSCRTVELLLLHGCDVNVLDGERHTAFYCVGEKLITSLHRSSDSRRVEIARYLTQTIAKLEAANAYLDDENIEILHSKKVKKFYVQCKDEIEEMKDTLLLNKVSFFDILIANQSKLILYARNDDVVETLNSNECKEKFPLYYKELQVRINRGNNMKNLISLGVDYLSEISNVYVPELVAENIFEYLECTDLKNVCRVCDVLKFVL